MFNIGEQAIRCAVSVGRTVVVARFVFLRGLDLINPMFLQVFEEALIGLGSRDAGKAVFIALVILSPTARLNGDPVGAAKTRA